MNNSGACNQKLALFNLTESSGGIASFVLTKNDHPYIYKNSDVNFGDGIYTDDYILEWNVKCGKACPQKNMDIGMVQKIAEVAVNHPAVSREIKILLREFWGF